MVHLKVVLLCKGRGADASSYRPNRDESQWWNRRDALVRCVGSFLYGPPPSFIVNNENCSRELVLIHDEDWSVTHLSLTNTRSCDPGPPPTEQFVLSAIKAAILNNQNKKVNLHSLGTAPKENVLKWIEHSGLKCRLVRNPDFALAAAASAAAQNRNGGTMSSSAASIAGLDSKRQVLQHLQKVCSIDFLRTHGLNSSPAVILRKTNKKSLVRIWYEWCKRDTKAVVAAAATTTTTTTAQQTDSYNSNKKEQQRALQSIIEDLLKPDHPTTQKVVAGLLHESLESELPCFGVEWQNSTRGNNCDHLQVCLFLGAVRDMHSWENEILKDTCNKTQIPLVKVRLGPVPEFTSKILTMVAYHQSQQWLGLAMTELVHQQQQQKQQLIHQEKNVRKRKRPNKKDDDSTASLEDVSDNYSPNDLITIPTTMHVMCPFPMSSKELSFDLRDRNRLLWCLVRITVCTLWRSRLASSSGSKSKDTHTNNPMHHLRTVLTFVFQDGLIMTFKQEELVSSLAEQHQAAPSEYQILAALCRKRDELFSDSDASVPPMTTLQDFVNDWIKNARAIMTTKSSSFVVDIHSDTMSQDLRNLAHSLPDSNLEIPTNETNSHSIVLVVLNLQSSIIDHPMPTAEGDNKQNTTREAKISFVERARQAIITECKKNSIMVRCESILGKIQYGVQDWEAANIVVLQHFAYQNRLIPCLRRLTKNMKENSTSESEATGSNNDNGDVEVDNIGKAKSEEPSKESNRAKKKKKKKKKKHKYEKKDR